LRGEDTVFLGGDRQGRKGKQEDPKKSKYDVQENRIGNGGEVTKFLVDLTQLPRGI